MMPNLSGAALGTKGPPDSAANTGLAITPRLLRRIDALAARLGRTPKTASHIATGLRGEETALFYLKSRGYVIVARRWSTPKLQGDVDLIGWEGETLCFIEVKTRTGRNIVPAEFSVDQHKQKTLRTLAAIYCKRLPETAGRKILVRFDVVSVYLPVSGADLPIEIDLFPDAFPRHAH